MVTQQTTAIKEGITVLIAVTGHRRRGRAAAGTGGAIETPCVIPMTDVRTHCAHFVTDAVRG